MLAIVLRERRLETAESHNYGSADHASKMDLDLGWDRILRRISVTQPRRAGSCLSILRLIVSARPLFSDIQRSCQNLARFETCRKFRFVPHGSRDDSAQVWSNYPYLAFVTS